MSRFRWEHDFLSVPASDVRAGDLYANGATVTDVTHGPFDASDAWETVAAGQTLIRCGEGFSSKGDSDRRVVVDRNGRRVAS